MAASCHVAIFKGCIVAAATRMLDVCATHRPLAIANEGWFVCSRLSRFAGRRPSRTWRTITQGPDAGNQAKTPNPNFVSGAFRAFRKAVAGSLKGEYPI